MTDAASPLLPTVLPGKQADPVGRRGIRKYVHTILTYASELSIIAMLVPVFQGHTCTAIPAAVPLLITMAVCGVLKTMLTIIHNLYAGTFWQGSMSKPLRKRGGEDATPSSGYKALTYFFNFLGLVQVGIGIGCLVLTELNKEAKDTSTCDAGVWTTTYITGIVTTVIFGLVLVGTLVWTIL